MMAMSSGVGCDYLHSAVDDHSRVAYSEIHTDERADACAAFLLRSTQFFAAHDAPVERVITDNARVYRDAHVFREAAALARHPPGVHSPPSAQTNGKVERFNRTLLEEWAYVLPYRSNERRTRLLEGSHTCTTTIDPTPR
jgi:transposase InsO family protein